MCTYLCIKLLLNNQGNSKICTWLSNIICLVCTENVFYDVLRLGIVLKKWFCINAIIRNVVQKQMLGTNFPAT